MQQQLGRSLNQIRYRCDESQRSGVSSSGFLFATVGSAIMHAFEILADPVRRRILELLATGELASGEVVAVIGKEFGISQPAVSQHLRILRENGFASVRAEGARRLYCVESQALRDVDSWLERFRRMW